MGLLSNAFNVVKNSVVGKSLDILTVAISHPVKTAQAIISPKVTINDVIKDSFSKPLANQIASTALGTASIAGTIVGGLAVSSAVKAGTLIPATINVAKSLIPTTVKGKLITAVATPVVLGAVASKPLESAKAVIKTPLALGNFGANVATFASNPTIANAKTIISENPVISSGVAIGTALTLGATATGIISTISTKQNTKAILENTKSLLPSTPEVIYASDPVVRSNLTPSSIVPVTPQTTAVTSGKTTKKRKSVSRKQYQNISQRVNVLVNSNNTKRYLNTIMLKN